MRKRKKVARPSPTIQRLRRRLQEAEDTLNAIRDGHVEALVVRSPEGEQIYTLHSADQPYRLMVEQMREGALTVGADGTILYCNDRFAELVAMPAGSITSQNLSQFFEHADLPRLRTMLDAEAFRDEFQLRTALGTSNPVQLSSAALKIDEVRTAAVVVTDLTHERTERGLRESNRLKDEFLATLSHELRTPLNVILGWTRMLMSDHLPESARRHAFELIDRNARAQAQLVNDLVDMSRITAGKLRLELESLPLIPVLEAALESIRPAAQAKNLTIETSWNVPEAVVLADATRLQQVLWNLFSNAVKFTPSGGRIVVTADQAGDRIRLDVSDTGIGIDRAFLAHVFDRFRQADSGATRTQGGLGLGLAIVRDLVRLHGGDVEAKSPGAGKGATFTVTLLPSTSPVRPAERRTRSRTSASLSGHRVMLVEDHTDSRDLLARALQHAGAVVVSFGAAREAFAALDRTNPSVIIADIALPDEDGYSFIRRVRTHGPAAVQSVPAIALTAYASDQDRAKALAVGFQAHLAKPIDPDQVVQAIHALTERALHTFTNSSDHEDTKITKTTKARNSSKENS